MREQNPEAWERYINDSAIELRMSNFNHGLVFEPTPGLKTIDAVREYMTSFGWNGAIAKDVAAAVDRSYRSVGTALGDLTTEGELRMVEEDTRGKLASKRKRFFPLGRRAPLVDHMPVNLNVLCDDSTEFFADTTDNHRPVECQPCARTDWDGKPVLALLAA